MLSLSYFITLLLLTSQHDTTAFQTQSTATIGSGASSQPVSSTTARQQQQQYRSLLLPSKQIIALSLLQQRTQTKLHMSDSDDGVSFYF